MDLKERMKKSIENFIRFGGSTKSIELDQESMVSIDDIKGEEFTFAHFQTLEKEGFLIGSIFTDTIYYYLTSKAVDYFSEKKKSIEADKKDKSIVTRR